MKMGKGGGRVLPVLIPFLLTSNSIYLVVVDDRVGCTIQAVLHNARTEKFGDCTAVDLCRGFFRVQE
jgi:nitrogen regulatory protein PII